MEKDTPIYFILRYRERGIRAKEITEIGYVTVTFQENISDARFFNPIDQLYSLSLVN
jgi:hypothetical protein